eukprot:gene10122-biopygen7110
MVLALQFTQCAGICHRDGGLQNWLLSHYDSPAPHPVLIDFGLSIPTALPLCGPDTFAELRSSPDLVDRAIACRVWDRATTAVAVPHCGSYRAAVSAPLLL